MKYNVRRNKKIIDCKTKKAIAKQVYEIAEPICTDEGIELVHVEYQVNPERSVLAIYIDKEGGVNLHDCTLISRQLTDILDIKMDLKEEYNLEVSSPGPARPISKETDFEKFAGNYIEIITTARDKKIQGLLKGIFEGMVNLIVNGEKVLVPFETIDEARLNNFHKGDL